MIGCLGLTSEIFLFFQIGGITVIVATIPQLLQDRICHNFYNRTICKHLAVEKYKTFQNKVQEETAFWMTFLPSSTLVTILLTILFVGPLSDRVGKRKLMIFSPLLGLIEGSLYLVFINLPGYFHPAWLFLPEIVPGIFGGDSGDILLSLGYQADITKIECRTQRISIAEGFYYIGVAIFSISTGILLKVVGFHSAFILYLAIRLFNLLYVLLVLPDEKTLIKTGNCDEQRETLLEDKAPDDGLFSPQDNKGFNSDKRRSPLKISSLLRLEDIKRCLNFMINGRAILVYLFLLFLARISRMGVVYIGTLYFKHSPFNMEADAIGIYAAIMYTVVGIGCWITVPLLQRIFNLTDEHLLVIGFFWQSVNRLILGLANSKWILYANVLTEIFGGISIPVIRSILTKCVPEDLHGSVLALGGVINASSALIGNLVVNSIYSRTVKIFPGIVMFVLAFVSAIGFVISIILVRRRCRITTK